MFWLVLAEFHLLDFVCNLTLYKPKYASLGRTDKVGSAGVRGLDRVNCKWRSEEEIAVLYNISVSGDKVDISNQSYL